MKILLISGHGAGDSGAVGCGAKEADLTRQGSYLLEGKLKAYDCKVERYPTSRNAYEDNKNGKLAVSFSSYDLIVEIHFNSYNGEAHGTEVLYRPDKMRTLASSISAAIAKVGFTNRGAKKRTDLMNMNTCTKLGVAYVLVETCFIDNAADMKLYRAKMDTVWANVCHAIATHYNIRRLASEGGDAARGWKKEGGVWYFYENGKKIKSAWRKDSTGKWCYLGKDGKQAKNAWIKYKNAWYYIKPDGYMAEDYWTQYKGGWYYLKADGVMATGKTAVLHKFDSDGKCIK